MTRRRPPAPPRRAKPAARPPASARQVPQRPDFNRNPHDPATEQPVAPSNVRP